MLRAVVGYKIILPALSDSPRAEVEFAFRYGHHDLTPHSLPLHVRIRIVLAGAVVLVLRYRLVRREFFQPLIVVVQQTVLSVINEHRRS